MGVIDLHTHSMFSDGELIFSELARRAEVRGYTAIAITDHLDASNLDLVVPRIAAAADAWNSAPDTGVRVVPGAEITHAPPSAIEGLIIRARELGARIVVVHGETSNEPVAPGTNRAGIMARCDILAHPGFITEQDAQLAAEHGVALEITYRAEHSLTNGHVVTVGRAAGVRWTINSDGHTSSDLLDDDTVRRIGIGAGMSRKELDETLRVSETLVVGC
jgi:histidinol phosphatase-like PHP family hydrolase